MPPRLSVCVCKRVWRGQRRTLCSRRGQRPGANLGNCEWLFGALLPGRAILPPLHTHTPFSGHVHGPNPRIFESFKSCLSRVILTPRPFSGAVKPANFPHPEAWGVYTRQPRALTAVPGLGKTQASGRAHREAAQQREAAPASCPAKFGLRGLPAGSAARVRATSSPELSVRAHGPPQASPERARRDSPEPRSQAARTMPRIAGHRPGRTAMAAGGRAGWTRGPAGGREAVSASAESPTSGRPRGPCQRTALPPGGRLRGARGAWLPWAPGAQQCSRGGAQRQPRRAPSQPPRGARSRGAGRRAPQNPDWSGGAGRRRGGAGEEGPRGAARGGHPRHRGSLRATPEAPPGRSWGSGRGGLPPPLAVSRDRDRSLDPGVDCFSGSGITLARQSAHRWPGRGPGLRRPRRSASLRRAARLWSAPGRFRCSPCSHPCLPVALRGRQRAAARSWRAAWMGGCRKGPGAQPARWSGQAPSVAPPATPKQPGGLQGHAQQRGLRFS